MSEAVKQVARVAVLRPIERAFDYSVPRDLRARVGLGTRVWAPWGNSSVEGVVVALDPPDSPGTLKPLDRLVDAPPIAADLLALVAWMADYYLAPAGEVLRLCLPAGGRAKARRRLQLTAAGRETVVHLGAALEPPHLAALDAQMRALLLQLDGGARDPEQTTSRPRAAAALRALESLGLVERLEAVRAPAGRTQVWLRATPAAATASTTPRRAEVLGRIVAAGEIALATLLEDDARAAAHVRELEKAGLVVSTRRDAAPPPRDVRVETVEPPRLTTAQRDAVAALEAAQDAAIYAPFLLHGVTGSGKTEVYLHAIAGALARGKSALVLVPEISLTPQLAARFRGRFGDRLAVLHSGLGDAERAAAWRRIQRGEVAIALGARSAVFAPLTRLGFVVVDEEHDGSFKQDEGLRYNGRDVALVRARQAGAVAVLGSATPSLETYHAAQSGRLRLLELPERATARPLPPIDIIDLRQHKLAGGLFSAPLERAIAETLAAGEQTILFLNRRGFSTYVLCKGCGTAARCRDCSVSLTYHMKIDRLICHYCGFRVAVPTTCSACGGATIERFGTGTERVETAVKERFPTARVTRLDRDTAEGDGLVRVLDAIRAREVDIIVGTQMIAKGHDFPGVTLVGVVSADHGASLPDFRAAERTYQLLEQVAGRAGRGDRPGRVMVQTHNPGHPAVAAARDHDYRRFAAQELAARQELGFPPASRLACLRFDGRDSLLVQGAAERVAVQLREAAAAAPADAAVGLLGPAEAPLSRLKGRTRWQLILRAASPRALKSLCRRAQKVTIASSVRMTVDIDPSSML